jgi:hypothetical protein
MGRSDILDLRSVGEWRGDAVGVVGKTSAPFFLTTFFLPDSSPRLSVSSVSVFTLLSSFFRLDFDRDFVSPSFSALSWLVSSSGSLERSWSEGKRGDEVAPMIPTEVLCAFTGDRP